MILRCLIKLMRLRCFLVSRRFQENLDAPQAAQERVFREIVTSVSSTQRGRELSLQATDTYDQWRSKVPLVNYDDIRELIDQQRSSLDSVLVPGPVCFYEKTSGSRGPAKYIPYNRPLRKSFHQMFLIWLDDLLAHGLKLKYGKVFMSVSPSHRTQEFTESGTPIGLEDDTEYIGGFIQWLLRHFLVVPPEVKRLKENDTFFMALSCFLLSERHLEVISIWNASLFLTVLDHISSHRMEISNHLKARKFKLEGIPFSPGKTDRKTLRELEGFDPINWQAVWPRLRLISAWDQGHAALAAKALKEKFPKVKFQGKGLLATEAPLTIPYERAKGFVPLANEVFFEFIDCTGPDTSRLRLLHELEENKEYEIVLSQKAGLVRYRLGDRVRVTHFYKETPCLLFLGRAGGSCDLVGEKLNETFLSDVLKKWSGIKYFSFALFVPRNTEKPGYELLTESNERVELSDQETMCLEDELDQILQEAFHYREARRLKQLEKIKIKLTNKVRDRYLFWLVQSGQKMGNIKTQSLLASPNQAASFLSSLDLESSRVTLG